ncbi:prolargin [Arapaima gigas]
MEGGVRGSIWEERGPNRQTAKPQEEREGRREGGRIRKRRALRERERDLAASSRRAGTSYRTMKLWFGFYSLLILLLLGAVWAQRARPRPRPRPTRRPPPPRPEPKEPTDFPPPILGPPSIFPDCPRECFCPSSYPNALYCESRNIRQIPIIPSRTHYLYLQNNYIDEVTAEPFKNATELKWINLDNNRIRRVERQVFEKLPNLLFLYMERNNLKEVPNDLPSSLEQLRLSHNQITKIPIGVFNKMEQLALLDLHHNKLSDSDLGKNIFRGLRNLVQLNLAHNILRKMPSNVPSNIYQLFLDKNNIEEIPTDYFKDFHNLAFIRLSYNQLSDKGVPKKVFNVSTLLDLHLAHNRLSTVPFFNTHLEQLYLNNNDIEAINGTEICPLPVMLMNQYDDHILPKLRYLRLDGNHLSPPVPMDIIMCFRHLRSIVI